jgi:hypothetical protein
MSAQVQHPSLSKTQLNTLLQADQELHWCIHNVHIQDEDLMIEAIQEGSAMAISDGSYKNTFGTVAWTIGNPDTTSLLSGQAVCPGEADNGLIP